MIWETVRLALQAILRNALRSFLTVLGVVIGVAAVIAMVTIGQGSSDQVTASVESLGTNVLILRPGRAMMGPGVRDDAPEFRLADAEAMSTLSVVAAAAPVASSTLTAVYGNANATTLVTGTGASYLDVLNWPVVRGRSFADAEERLLGRLELILGGGEIPLPAKAELLVGREDPVSGIYPDVDLTPHGGEEGGVSRRHARIVVDGDNYFVVDLDSTNFTFVNKQKLTPGTQQQVQPGEEIRFGRVAVVFQG